MTEMRQRRLRVALVVAMVASPYLGLLYGIAAGLVALEAGLLATAFLAFDAARQPMLESSVRRRLVAAGTANLGLALAAGLLLLFRLR